MAITRVKNFEPDLGRGQAGLSILIDNLFKEGYSRKQIKIALGLPQKAFDKLLEQLGKRDANQNYPS